MPNKIIAFTLLLALLRVGVYGQTAAKRHAITEEQAIAMVMRLPEVRESNAYILKHSRDKRKLFAMTYGEPTAREPYWWIAVGEDNGMCFVTHFGFYVAVKSGRIYYVDTLNGRQLDLRTWRKARRTNKLL